jgi:hypothetical protein
MKWKRPRLPRLPWKPKWEHLGVAVLAGLLVFGVVSFGLELRVGIQRARATEYSESQQRERQVKAQEAQAKALTDIARSLKDIGRKCK